jgi:hypothetical protein
MPTRAHGVIFLLQTLTHPPPLREVGCSSFNRLEKMFQKRYITLAGIARACAIFCYCWFSFTWTFELHIRLQNLPASSTTTCRDAKRLHQRAKMGPWIFDHATQIVQPASKSKNQSLQAVTSTECPCEVISNVPQSTVGQELCKRVCSQQSRTWLSSRSLSLSYCTFPQPNGFKKKAGLKASDLMMRSLVLIFRPHHRRLREVPVFIIFLFVGHLVLLVVYGINAKYSPLRLRCSRTGGSSIAENLRMNFSDESDGWVPETSLITCVTPRRLSTLDCPLLLLQPGHHWVSDGCGHCQHDGILTLAL